MRNKSIIMVLLLAIATFYISSCSSDNPITQIFSNEVAAKDRLDAANSQAISSHGPNTKLVLIFGQNVKSNGKTDISTLTAITDPGSIGAWLYIYRVPGDTANSSLRVFTPNPIPGTSDCLELTAFFNINTIVNLIQDSASKSIVSGALNLLENSGVNITTPSTSLINSDAALSLAVNTSPILKFNSSGALSTSTQNGTTFFSSGTNQSRNMFLIPAAGTLNLPPFVTQLTGFPSDLWMVNFRKTDNNNVQQSMTLGTVVQSGQLMGIQGLTVTSPVINVSSSAQ